MKKYSSQKVFVPSENGKRHLSDPKKQSLEQRITKPVKTRSESRDKFSSPSDMRFLNSVVVQMNHP